MKVFTKIKAFKEISKGVALYSEIEENALSSLMRYKDDRDYIQAEIEIKDPRLISTEQRKKIYATIRDIADHTGYLPEEAKEYLKYDFMIKENADYFSLSNCSVTTAREFINYLIEFCIEFEVRTKEPLLARTDDINKYLYFCLKYRVCAITGKPNADIHHIKGYHIGMGRNRHKVDHSKLKIIALSREWHTKVHTDGEKAIFEKYKVYGIFADKVTLKVLGLSVKDIS